MKVIEVLDNRTFSKKDKDGKVIGQMRAVSYRLEPLEGFPEIVTLYQDEKDQVPEVGFDFDNTWETKLKEGKAGYPDYYQIFKKQEKKEKQWNGYQKKEVNPRAYLINTCLPSVLPEILSKKLCIESFFKVMEQCLDWVDGNYKFSEVSQEQFKALHALLKEHGYTHEDIHTLFSVESIKEITLNAYNSFMRQVQNMPKDEAKKFLKGLMD